ncbi:MAG: arginine--tRNA ligase, partial [Pseudomonadota bacterium]
MNLFAEIKTTIAAVLEGLSAAGDLPGGLDPSNMTVEPPRDAAHGDMATNAAMVLAKQARMKPRDLAEIIAAALRLDDRFTEVTVAGPGFINLRLGNSIWLEILRAALVERTHF